MVAAEVYPPLMPPLRSHAPLQRLWRAASGALASVFFPSDCRLCKQLLTDASRLPLCEQCLASFKEIQSPICQLCGQPESGAPADPEVSSLCAACQEQTYRFHVARSFAVYEGALARAIVMLKFAGMEPLGEWFARQLENVVLANAECLEADVVVPVPLHRNRQKERGYTQVDLFARPLSKWLGVSFRPVLLMRTRPRPEKHLLDYEERWEAVRGAFAMKREGRVDNLRVLLLDDVMTTGATLDACAKALREAGASSVLGLTVARAVHAVGPDVVRV
jgi:ComF family protein